MKLGLQLGFNLHDDFKRSPTHPLLGIMILLGAIWDNELIEPHLHQHSSRTRIYLLRFENIAIHGGRTCWGLWWFLANSVSSGWRMTIVWEYLVCECHYDSSYHQNVAFRGWGYFISEIHTSTSKGVIMSWLLQIILLSGPRLFF